MTLFAAAGVFAQTNLAVLAPDGAWTWYNDPRAIYHNDVLYFGCVRKDGKTALNCFSPATGRTTPLWESGFTQADDHNNPGLLVKNDRTLLALYARHGTDHFFAYRHSMSTNPISGDLWGNELLLPDSGAGLTYANPCQLSEEAGRVYNFSRNQNFNPTVFTSDDGGFTWSAPRLMIRNGTGSIRPYVKYASDYKRRIEILYTDGHPRNINNSLYHLYYQAGAFYRTDGSLIKSFSSLPIQHDQGERGSVIYQYSTAETADPNDHIAGGRAWCWEVVRAHGGQPVALFTVQKDGVTGTSWTDARIFYYYARWTGTNWQKTFIAHAGRPLYTPEDDYAGGICADPENPEVVYISSNALNPFNTFDINVVPLRSHYELWRGLTSDGGLTFSWTQVTSNSVADNLRPFVPRHQTGVPSVIWFRGSYSSYTSYDCQVVGLFPHPVPQPPNLVITSPKSDLVMLTNIENSLNLEWTGTDDGIPGPLSCSWSTVSGPAAALFTSLPDGSIDASFPQPGTYRLRLSATDGGSEVTKDIVVNAGAFNDPEYDSQRTLWLKFDETTGRVASDSSGFSNHGSLSGAATWRPEGGLRAGALQFDGVGAVVTIQDAPTLDNANAFTLSYWFYANDYPSDSAGLVSKRDGASVENSYTTYLKAANKLLYVDIEGSTDRFASASQINTGTWYHVGLVFDGSKPASVRATLYLNGKLDVTANESSSAVADHTSAMRIGNTHSGAANWFNGLIDDVRFYRRALSSADIGLLAATNFLPSIEVVSQASVRSGIPTEFRATVSDDSSENEMSYQWTQVKGRRVISSQSENLTNSVTFTKAGDYALRFSAQDSQGAVAQTLQIRVAANTNVFADWISAFYPNVAEVDVVGAEADPDADGAANLLEFALGTSPVLHDLCVFSIGNPGLPCARIEAFDGTNYLTMEVRRPQDLFGISYSAGVSEDLSLPLNLWSVAERIEGARDKLEGMETIEFRDLLPLERSQTRFMRLRIQKEPGW